jgi:hypothetical protein
VAEFLDEYEAEFGSLTPEQRSQELDLSPSLANMQVTDTPYTVASVDNFLPAGLFNSVQKYWPEPQEHEDVKLDEAVPYLGSRQTKLVETRAGEAEDVEAAGVWNTLALTLRSPRFVRPLFERFSSVVEENLANLGSGKQLKSGFRLYLNFDRGTNEALGAHIDALRKLMTIVVYVDISGPLDDKSAELWGTTLYFNEAGSIKPVKFSRNTEHEVAGHILFRPNRAFIMPNAANALHGVVGGQQGVVRRTVMCGYWVSFRD